MALLPRYHLSYISAFHNQGAQAPWGVPWQNVYKLPKTSIQASGLNKPAF
ncbi:unnamed protein product [Staurois parvus]|uniref:Uncharacterized protein n=1 Tax=Staurois parvus TaxID=386267 RepID=A0ABN9GL72_9NEOB|nr:unnamed protein product [Staurois parvus]